MGRTGEVKRIAEMVKDQTLVTLTGPGGVGKTRLALEIAVEASAEFSDGVFFVDLSSLVEGTAVGHALLSALGAQKQAGGSSIDSVVDALSDRAALVVLDNCEHVLGSIRELLTAL